MAQLINLAETAAKMKQGLYSSMPTLMHFDNNNNNSVFTFFGIAEK